MPDSTCWIGQEYRLASDVQRPGKINKLGGSRCANLTALHRSDHLFIMQEYKAQPRLQREGGRENLRIGLQQVIATLLRQTQIGLCTVVQAFIWRRSSAILASRKGCTTEQLTQARVTC